MYIILSRKKAFHLAWMIFRMATGTKRIKLSLGTGENEDIVVIEGDCLIEGEVPK